MAKIAWLLLRLYVRREKISLDFYVWMSPCSALPLGLSKNFEVEFPNLFPNLLRLSPNFSPNFL